MQGLSSIRIVLNILKNSAVSNLLTYDLPSPALEPPSRPKQASLASLSIATCWPKMLWVYLAKSVSQCFLVVDGSSLNASLG